MIKSLYLANGWLVLPLPKRETRITVDGATAQYIIDSLQASDWAYLKLQNQDNIEIVKIYVDPQSNIRAVRSEASVGFPSGSSLSYTLTVQEIQDRVDSTGVEMFSAGDSPIEVNGNKIVYPDVSVQNLGGSESFIAGALLRLETTKEAVGCCDIINTGAPNVPNPFFYLTSTLYPVETTDYDKVDFLRVFRTRWTTEPLDRVFSAFNTIAGQLYGGSKAYVWPVNTPNDPDNPFDNFLRVEFIPNIQGQLYGSAKQYNMVHEDTKVSAYILTGQLFAGGVEYDNYKDPLVKVGFVSVAGTLQ